ncbi:sensor histidine kinase [Sulfitobacter sp. 1A12126]|uniref:sensor histidine kinase n=1 Tax=Sulfitobacter sp. 1A12126 TaxID=3368591 RepID=UPI0037463BD2
MAKLLKSEFREEHRLVDRNAKPPIAQQAESDHRLANSIQFAAAMLRHESRQISDVKAAKTALTNAAERLNAIARLHRQLTQDLGNADVELATYLEPFCEDLSRSIGVELAFSSPEIKLHGCVAAQFCIILNELAMNAVKHGGHDGQPVIMTVVAKCSVDSCLKITVRDNGLGLPEDFTFEGSNGLGMMIITSTVQKLGGDISRLPGQGTGFEISLPFEAWNGASAEHSHVTH